VTKPPQVVVSASIAYDHIMQFDGSFKDHILADKAHVLSVSFLLGSLKHQRGGVAGNMGYTMALLGVPVALVGAVGLDFEPYGQVLEALGVDLGLVRRVEDDLTATAYMNADMAGNQIAAFYPGPSALTREIDVTPLARDAAYGIVSAGDPIAMMLHTEQIAAATNLIFDPAQQIVILDGDQLSRGIELANVVVGNDYELGMIERKTGYTVDDIARKVPMTVVTYGDRGSEIRAGGEVVPIPTVKPEPFTDPTGGGDAYRAGLVAGLLLDKDLPVAGRMAALAATYAIEFHGTQEHTFTRDQFVERYRTAFPEFAGDLSVEDFGRLSARSASIAP